MPTGEPNLFGLHQFDNRTSYFSGRKALPESEGWSILLAFGAFFVVITSLLSWFDQKFGGTEYNSEDFATAGRSIKTGLIAVDVIAKWGWVSDILQSGYEAYSIGVAGAYWYSAGAIVQIMLFGITAIEVKQRAPSAHTFLELVRKRWGHVASIVFMYLGLCNNVVVTSVNLIGASVSLTAATGVNVYACLMLIPAGIILYTTTGGLKATFTSSYIHTVMLYIALCIFMFTVYASDKVPVGSIRRVYDNTMTFADAVPVAGNKGGKYLTFWSRDGLQFGILSIIGSFGNVWADQSYWQSAIAASPIAACRGYVVGGLLWFAIPLCYATSTGLAAIAADLPLSEEEATNGLVPCAVGDFLLGKTGVWIILAVVFMAVTSACSSEFMAVSSIFTYDVYKPYLSPKAKGKELLWCSRLSVVGGGLLLGGISCLFQWGGVNINFLYLVVGVLVSSSVPPLVSMLAWPAVPAGAAISSALIGQVSGIASWIIHTKLVYKELNIETLQEIGPSMTGNVASLMVSLFVMTTYTLLFPDKTGSYQRFKDPIETMDGVVVEGASLTFTPELEREYRFTIIFAGMLSFIFAIGWPLLSLPAGVFSFGYFSFFIYLSFVWGVASTVICTFLPIFESRELVLKVLTCGAYTGKYYQDSLTEDLEGVNSSKVQV